MVKNQASIDIHCYTTFLISSVHINDDLIQNVQKSGFITPQELLPLIFSPVPG